MSTEVTLAILFAAFLHALWNFLLKGGTNSFLDSTVIVGTSGIIGLILLLFLGLPHPDSWRYLISSAFIHMSYLALLANSYRFGDLSVVYTIVRGTPPMLVALGGFIFAKEVLSFSNWLGIFLISIGIIALGIKKTHSSINLILFCLGTILAITSYTIIDAMGVRLSGNSASYFALLALIDALGYVTVSICLKRRKLLDHIKRHWWRGGLGSIFSFSSYLIALIAMTKAPMGIVSALRETTVLMGLLLGVFFLSEKINKTKIFSSIVVVCGVAVLKLF